MQFTVLICELKAADIFKIPIRQNKLNWTKILQSQERGGLQSVRGGGVRPPHPRQESFRAVQHGEGRGRTSSIIITERENIIFIIF